MTGIGRAIAALLLLALAPAAQAKFKSADQMKPDKAYLLVQVDPVEVQMMGTSRAVTGIVLAPYDPEGKRIPDQPVAGDKTGMKRAAPQVLVMNDPIAKDGKKRLFLVEVDPGVWVIEGTSGAPVLVSATTSFSLGSYYFETKAGELADLGVFVPQREESDNPDTKMTGGKLVGMALFAPFGGGRVEPSPNRLTIRPRGDGDIAVPAWLAGRPTVQPAFVYGGTFANRLGGLVNRVDGKDGRGRAAGEAAHLSRPTQPAAAVEPLPATPAEAAEIPG